MIVVFAGPTISHDEIKQHVDCICLPPACHGDIIRCLPDGPSALGIVDGYFEGAPSVWHKEILYALDQGVHVFGSSSMGALRAAELHLFGMQGVGQIFDWYKEGVVTDDDEVAVLHGPAEVDFIVASEPMVNIRATLALAQHRQILNKQQTELLIDTAKQTFYKQRSWTRILESCTHLLNDTLLTAHLEDWLKHNRIDLKKRDAIELLKTMKQIRVNHPDKHRASFHFEWTNVWDSAFHEHGKSASENKPASKIEREIVDQLRLDPVGYERYRDKALLGWVAANPDYPLDVDADVKAAFAKFRVDNQLGARSQLTTYMNRAMLNESDLSELLENASRVNQLRLTAGDLQTGIIEQLKLDGHYIDLLDIVSSKQEMSESTNADTDSSGLLPPQILAWYFKHRLGTTIPQRLENHIARIGLDQLEEFYRLIAADYLYWSRQE